MYDNLENKSSLIEIPYLTDEILVYSLNILSIDCIVHIFVAAKDKINQHNCIYHFFLNSDEWINEKVTEIDFSKYNYPYFLDFFEEDIYLLYCRNVDLGEYAIIKYNTLSKRWNSFEEGIFIKNANNLNFVISPSGMEIIYFNKIVNGNSETHILYKALNNLNSVWNYNNISSSNSNDLKPIIFFKKPTFYYLWNTGTSIRYKKSDNLINWSKEFEINVKESNMKRLTYISNFSQDRDLKINLIYFSYLEAVNEIINSNLNYSGKSLRINSLEENKNNTTILKHNSEYFASEDTKDVEYNESYIRKLRLELERKDKAIEELKNLIDNYIMELDKLKIERIKKSFANLERNNLYEVKIESLRQEKDSLIKNANKRIRSLLNILEEKERIIIKLHNIIESKNRFL